MEKGLVPFQALAPVIDTWIAIDQQRTGVNSSSQLGLDLFYDTDKSGHIVHCDI